MGPNARTVQVCCNARVVLHSSWATDGVLRIQPRYYLPRELASFEQTL
jgi:hypothetical protein